LTYFTAWPSGTGRRVGDAFTEVELVLEVVFVAKVLEVDFELIIGGFDEVVKVEAMEVVHFGLPVVVVALDEMLDVVALEVVLVVLYCL
jgi:hypothetical protein